MIKLCQIISILIYFDLSVYSQIPDLNKYKSVEEKLSALDKYIESNTNKEKYNEAKNASLLALNLAKQAKIDSSIIKNLYNTAQCYKSLSNFDSAIYFFVLLQKTYKQIRPDLYVKAQLSLASSYENIGQMDSVFSIMKSLEMNNYIQTDSLTKENIKFLMYRGVLNEDRGNYEKALSDYMRALRISQALLDTNSVTENLINIGAFYFNIENYPKCIEYYEQAKINLFKAGKQESLQACIAYRTIGIAYGRTGNFAKGINYAKEAIQIAQKLSIIKLLNFCYTGIATIYLEKKDYDQAERYYLLALNILKNTNLKFNKLTAYGQLGMVNFEKKKFTQAKSYFEKANQLALELGRKSSISSSYKDLAKTEAALGNYSKAYNYQLIYNQYKDSLTTETTKKNIAEMEAKYQNDIKLKEISLLSEKNKTQTLELKNKKQQQYILIAGLLAIMLIAGLLWRSYGIKKRSNKELAMKNDIISNAYEEITVMNEKLNEANQSKSKLFSILSHDLRSPVTSLFQFLSIQRDSPELLDEATRKKNSELILQSAENLAEVMEDLLIWSKSQMEHFDLSLESVNLRSLLNEIIQINNIMALQKNIAIELECSDDLDFITDANFLKVIARNLINNAINHSPQNGKVRISAKKTSERFMISIKNQGISMTKEQIENLKDWQNLKSSPSGIGLKLTLEFIEKLNGQLEILQESEGENQILVSFIQSES